jgi:hypothetical protein
MKKGKTSKINGYSALKTTYGTVDSKNIKSLYVNIQSWVNPKMDYELNWNRVVLNLSRQIKHLILEIIDRKIFEDLFIVDLDLRTSGIQHGKKSFMNLEINIYLREQIDFKSTVLRDSIKKIINHIFQNCIKSNEYFEFSLSKKEKIFELSA